MYYQVRFNTADPHIRLFVQINATTPVKARKKAKQRVYNLQSRNGLLKFIPKRFKPYFTFIKPVVIGD